MSHASSSSWGVPTSSWGYNVGMCRSIARGCQCSARVRSGLTLTGPHTPGLLVTHVLRCHYLLPTLQQHYIMGVIEKVRHLSCRPVPVSHLPRRSKRSRVSPMSLCSFTNRDWSTEEMARSTRLEPVTSSNMGLIFPYSAEE
jgi:hypothetical protein